MRGPNACLVARTPPQKRCHLILTLCMAVVTAQYSPLTTRLAQRCFIFIVLLLSTLTSAAADILIVQSHDSVPYQQTLAGFQSALKSDYRELSYQTLVLSRNTENQLLNGLMQQSSPKLLLTLGTPATRAALLQVKNTPIVAGLVLDTDELRHSLNATGVGLNFPAHLQWLWLQRLLPDARKIAVLYDPQQGLVQFQALQKQAQAVGVTLIQAPVVSAEDLPAVMQNLPPQLDALWAVDGASAYSAATVRELLLYSFRNRVPLIGLSAQWVKAGALYALDWDYQDLGAQAADLAKAILLKGIPPTSLSPLTPRKVRTVFNGKTAEHMRLPIEDRWRAEMVELSE